MSIRTEEKKAEQLAVISEKGREVGAENSLELDVVFMRASSWSLFRIWRWRLGGTRGVSREVPDTGDGAVCPGERGRRLYRHAEDLSDDEGYASSVLSDDSQEDLIPETTPPPLDEAPEEAL